MNMPEGKQQKNTFQVTQLGIKLIHLCRGLQSETGNIHINWDKSKDDWETTGQQIGTANQIYYWGLRYQTNVASSQNPLEQL